jgi:hypothetical protein
MTGFVMESDCADHYTIGLYPKVKTKPKLLKSVICAPLQDLRSLAYMRQFFNCIDWTPVISDCTVTSFDKFAKIMPDASEICCPMTAKTLSSKPREPWFSKGLLVSRGTKEFIDRLVNQIKTHKNGQLLKNTETSTLEQLELQK